MNALGGSGRIPQQYRDASLVMDPVGPWGQQGWSGHLACSLCDWSTEATKGTYDDTFNFLADCLRAHRTSAHDAQSGEDA